MLWQEDGTPLQGFLGCKGDDRRAEYILTFKAHGGKFQLETNQFLLIISIGEKYHYYMEMICTAMFGNGTGSGWGGLGPNPTDLNKKYQLEIAEIGVFDRLASELLLDFTILQDLAKVNKQKNFKEDS
jgi:hypothetical protein